MSKIRVGIVGYGNLGKSIEKNLSKNNDFTIVSIFSRRNINSTYFNKINNTKDILNFKNKIDILFLCGGSKSDTYKQALYLSKYFNTIDTFDNHRRIKNYLNKMNKSNLKNKTCSIISCGWDPGLFSMIRTLIKVIGNTPYTFWGKGVSQGHTQALMSIKGVNNAIQYTIPNKKVIRSLNSKNLAQENSKILHKRLCYINIKPNTNRKEIIHQIKTMPDYFEGYKTKIKFKSEKFIQKKKTEMNHAGLVKSENNEIQFSLSLKSNPDFTSRVVIAYCYALSKYIKLKNYGCKTVLDIPLSDLVNNFKNSEI